MWEESDSASGRLEMSNESESEDAQSFLDVELETLRSIYVNELEVFCSDGYQTCIAIQLYPATADNVDQRYVRMSLIFGLPAQYPDIVPDIEIKNSRGLSDEKLQRIMSDLLSKAEERKGGTMLFELIECAKDHLTAGNRPSCQCAICLYGFTEQDVFTKTKCYHYFHSDCLSRYVTHQFKEFEAVKRSNQTEGQKASEEVLCPVCRIPISVPLPDDCSFPPPTSAEEDTFIVTEELKELQSKMAYLYEKQKIKGGIIDIEAEKKKFLLEISSVASDTEGVAESTYSNSPRKNSSALIHQDLIERKKESATASSKVTRSAQNNSRNNQTSKRYDKHNQVGKDSEYALARTSHVRINKSYHGQKCNVEIREVQEFIRPSCSTCITDEKSIDSINPGTTEMRSESSTCAYVENKPQISGRTHSGLVCHKRYKKFNRHNNFHKQNQCTGDGRREGECGFYNQTPFGMQVDLSNGKNANSPQCLGQSIDHYPHRNTGNHSQAFQNAENHSKHCEQSTGCHENWQQEGCNNLCSQSIPYHQSRQDFYRKPKYHARNKHFRATDGNQRILHCGSDKIHCRRTVTNPVQNSHPDIKLKCHENSEYYIREDVDQIYPDESSQKFFQGYKNVSKMNYDSSHMTTNPQKERLRYQNKCADVSRRSANVQQVQQLATPMLSENGVLRCQNESMPKKEKGSGCEERESSSSCSRQQDYATKMYKSCDVSHTVVHISTDCSNDIFCPVLTSCSSGACKESNSNVLKTTGSHSASQPPPGFAKKVIYGLPSMKPPPGFYQS